MDLDETMTTSTSSTPSVLQDNTEIEGSFDDDDNLFPDPASGAGDVGITDTDRPQTPPTNNHTSAAAPGELSPPQSQPHSQSDETPAPAPTTQITAAGASVPNGGHGYPGANTAATRSAARPAPTAGLDAQRDDTAAASQPPGSERDERPGWGWKSKKAQDEMQRAWDSIIDRDFSLKEYGDVVARGKARLAQS